MDEEEETRRRRIITRVNKNNPKILKWMATILVNKKILRKY